MTYRKLAFHPLRSVLSRGFARATAGVLGAATPLMALANPTGGQVVAGSATIGSGGANGTVINQNSQNAIINWQQFNVGANQYVQFVQPNSSSVVLNRVIGGNASQIFGDIRANGQVFLVNPNGIYFAPGATLDVQGVVASTLDISNADFMAGRYVFSKSSGAPDAGVDNQGEIHVGRGGYVVLAGDYAQNQGSIDAQFGKVYLAAGNSATLTLSGQQLISYTVDGTTLSRLAGVKNSGEITALGGRVVMTADVANALTATAVNNTGLIAARSVRDHGGEIVLAAEGGDIYNSGRLDASAAQDGVAGGTVIVHAEGGDTELAPASLIDTSGQYAKGGFVDISGHSIGVRGFVNTGKGGNLLLDPQSIEIVPGNGTGGHTNALNSVGTGFIKNQLNSGHNVTIVASNQIFNSAGVTGVTATGTGNLTIEIGTVSCPTGICTTGTPTITPGTNGTINLSGFNINIGGGFLASTSIGNVTLGNVTAASVKITAANVTTGTLHATGVASTGDVVVRGSQSVSAFGSGNIIINGNVTADHGNVDLLAKGGGDSSGGNLTVTGAIKAGGVASISAHYIGSSSNGGGRIKLGNVSGQTVTITSLTSHPSISVGSITATQQNDGQDDVQIQATHIGAGSQNALIKVNGPITAGEAVFIAATGGDPLVSVAAITGNTKGCPISDCSAPSVSISAAHGTIKVNGPIVVDQDPFTRPGVFLDGRVVNFGNITAPGNVSISASTISSINHAGITQAPNTTIKARDISIDLNASYGGVIKLANLTASSANGPAIVEVDALSHNAGNSIVVTGNITVNGKGANRGFSSAMPGAGVPIGALVDLQASGSSAAAHTIKVTGNITANTKAGAFNHTDPGCSVSCGTSGPRPTVHAAGNGGLAKVNISASGSHGNVNLGGNVTVTGPAAAVDVKGTVINVAGNITTTGIGGSDSVDVLASTYHTHFVGPGPITNVSLGGASSAASVTVGGTVSVIGPGLVGVDITGGKVALGGLNVTASAAANYSVLDTRLSTTTDKFTLGSAAVLVFQASGGSILGPATIAGAVSLNAPHGNVFLESKLKAGGQISINALKNFSGNATAVGVRIGEIGQVVGTDSGSGSPGIPSAAALPLQLTAPGISMIAGGNIDLTSATVSTPATGVAALKAGGNIVLSGVDIHVGTFVAYAGGTIHNGGTVGSISADAVAFRAGKALTLSSTDITVGSASVPQDSKTVAGNPALKAILADTAFAATLTGDPQLAAGFAAGGIPVTSVVPNAAFIAGGAVSLGSLTLKGGYLYLQGTSVSLGGTVTAPKGLVVQVAPASPTGITDLEGQGAAGANLNLNNTGFVDQFGDGITLVLGASGQTGDISLGNNGSFDIGSDNLILDTSGNVTGLDKVTSTGIVSSLEALLGSLVVPPTSGEIDPDSANNNNAAGDKKHQNQGGESEGADSTQGGTITQDTSASSACH